MIVSTGIGGLRSNGGTNRARWILFIRINVRGQELRTERVRPPLMQVASVVLRLDTDGLGADAIDEP